MKFGSVKPGEGAKRFFFCIPKTGTRGATRREGQGKKKMRVATRIPGKWSTDLGDLVGDFCDDGEGETSHRGDFVQKQEKRTMKEVLGVPLRLEVPYRGGALAGRRKIRCTGDK